MTTAHTHAHAHAERCVLSGTHASGGARRRRAGARVENVTGRGPERLEAVRVWGGCVRDCACVRTGERERAAGLTVYAWQCLLERPKQRTQPRQQKVGARLCVRAGVHEWAKTGSSPPLCIYVRTCTKQLWLEGGEIEKEIFTYCSEFFGTLAKLSFSFWKSRWCRVKQTHNRALPLQKTTKHTNVCQNNTNRLWMFHKNKRKKAFLRKGLKCEQNVIDHQCNPLQYITIAAQPPPSVFLNVRVISDRLWQCVILIQARIFNVNLVYSFPKSYWHRNTPRT